MNVYLDYAATAPMLPEVLEALLPYYQTDFGNPDSLHAYGRRAAHAVLDARDRIAAVLHVKPAEVYFTSGGTEADNWAVRGLGTGRALVSAIEHAAVLAAAPLREGGHAVIPAEKSGLVSLESVEEGLKGGAGLVCLMAVNNETGAVQPVKETAALCRAHGALLFSDCVQAACSQPLQEICSHADAFSLSAHKIGGPKGVGALIVKKGAALSPLIAGGEQERGLRGGTLNVAGVVGFAKALEMAQADRERFCTHTKKLRELFETEILAALKGEVRVDGEDRAPNISHITFEGGGASLVNVLDLKGVACSGGAACSAHAGLPSHVLLAMGRGEEAARRGVRFSFGLQTTEEEVIYAARTVISLLRAK